MNQDFVIILYKARPCKWCSMNRDVLLCAGLTPFRRAMNAGDPYLTVNSAPSSTITPPPSNQVNAPTRTSLAGWGVLAGSTKTVPGGSAYTGNPKYVYDSSDYVRFKKLQAKNR